MSFDAKTDCGTLSNFDHLAIVAAPHPALDTASEFVVEIDASVRLLAARMMALMYAGVPDGHGGVTRGIGLAANQVNVLRRVIVVDIPGKKSVRGLVPAVVTRGPVVMVNPVVTLRMSALEWRSEVERCLSHPGVAVAIERPVTGERKVKKGAGVGSRGGGECGGVYDYYRCSRYNAPGHAGGRVRVSGRKLEEQVLEALRSLRITDEELAAVWRQNLVERAQWLQKDAGAQRDELQRQQRLVAGQKGRLLEAYLSGHVDKAALEEQSGKLKDREASLSLQLEGLGRAADEDAELAVKVFELSQSLHSQWKTADDAAKGVILELTCLNLELVGEKLVFSWRKPFDLVAKGLSVCSNRSGETSIERFVRSVEGLGVFERQQLLRIAG